MEGDVKNRSHQNKHIDDSGFWYPLEVCTQDECLSCLTLDFTSSVAFLCKTGIIVPVLVAFSNEYIKHTFLSTLNISQYHNLHLQ